MFGLGDELRRRQREAWDASTEELSRAELRAAAARSGGQLVFVIGYVGALVARRAAGDRRHAVDRRRPVHGDPRLADHDPDLDDRPAHEPDAVDDARGRRAQLAARRRGAPGARRASPTCRCRPRSRTGSRSRTSRSRIRARTSRCSSDVDLRLPAGAVVALVGENGAGKTTLVKLIGRFYEPTAGSDHARRRGHPPLRPRRLARAPHGRVPGLRAARGARARDGRRRRPPEPRRRRRSSSTRSSARTPTTSSRRCRTASRRRSGGRGRTAASSPAASGRSSRSAAR